jgi:hypothetical protein
MIRDTILKLVKQRRKTTVKKMIPKAWKEEKESQDSLQTVRRLPNLKEDKKAVKTKDAMKMLRF